MTESVNWRPAALLSKAQTRDAPLHFVVVVLCFLACLAALTSLAATRAAQGWARDLRGEATVQVRARPGEPPEGDAAKAAEALGGVKGVVEAQALDRRQAEDLVKPWLGNVVLADLPIPLLVAVRLDPKTPATAADMEKALKAAGLDANVDDHGRWLKDVESAAAAARWAGLLAFALTAAAAAAAVVSATRSGLAARRDVVEVLHLSGADDAYVAGLFQTRFARLAAESGVVGAALAAAVVAACLFLSPAGGLTPVLPFAYIDLLWLLPCPLIAAMLAALAARAAALGYLRRTE